MSFASSAVSVNRDWMSNEWEIKDGREREDALQKHPPLSMRVAMSRDVVCGGNSWCKLSVLDVTWRGICIVGVFDKMHLARLNFTACISGNKFSVAIIERLVMKGKAGIVVLFH